MKLMKVHNSLNFSRPYGKLLNIESPKTGGSKELFPPENDFKTSTAVNFPKNKSRFGRPGNQLNEDTKCRLEFFLYLRHMNLI